MKRKGFTLVEFLVVIVMIALMVFIQLPALGATRKHAKTIICLSDLKQWGLVTFLYGYTFALFKVTSQ